MTSHEDWPTEETTVVRQPADPVVGPPAPFTPPPGEPVPPGPNRWGPDDGIGWGFLVGILLLLIVGGIVAAILLTRDDNKKATTTTVVVRTGTTTTVPAAGGVRTTTVTTATTPAVQTPPVTTPAKSAITTTVTTTTTAATTPTTSASSTPSGASGTPGSGSSGSGSGGSAQPTSVSVPDVGTGSAARDAVQKLNAAGLLATIAYVPSDQPFGTVVAESPQAGASSSTGSHVTLNLSAGRSANGTASVPDVTGKTIPEAVAAMKQAGIRMFFVRKTVTDQSQGGTVVEQTPAAGTSVPKNAQVLVYMGAFR